MLSAPLRLWVLLALALVFVAWLPLWRRAFWNTVALLHNGHLAREWRREQRKQAAESGARFAGMMPDDGAVAALLRDVGALLTGDENRRLQEHAAAIIEHNGAAFEIVVAASSRFGGANDQDVLNSRQALALYLSALATQPALERMNEIAGRG
jgi:hypothetical protein